MNEEPRRINFGYLNRPNFLRQIRQQQQQEEHDSPENECINELEKIVLNNLKYNPFPINHPDRMQMVAFCVHEDSEIKLTCFLIEHGYVDLYEEISDALNHSLYDLPLTIRSRIENSFLKFISEESNETFLDDHKKRERGDSTVERLDEIMSKFPLKTATKKMVNNCPKCAICQYKIKQRQHVRQICDNCVYHTTCAENFLKQSRSCAICRRVVITDS